MSDYTLQGPIKDINCSATGKYWGPTAVRNLTVFVDMFDLPIQCKDVIGISGKSGSAAYKHCHAYSRGHPQLSPNFGKYTYRIGAHSGSALSLNPKPALDIDPKYTRLQSTTL